MQEGHKFALVAQLVELLPLKQEVVGSSPTGSTTNNMGQLLLPLSWLARSVNAGTEEY